MTNPITKHLRIEGYTYVQHFRRSLGFSVKCLFAGITSFVHAFFPFVFQTKSGDTIRGVYKKYSLDKSKVNFENTIDD